MLAKVAAAVVAWRQLLCNIITAALKEVAEKQKEKVSNQLEVLAKVAAVVVALQ